MPDNYSTGAPVQKYINKVELFLMSSSGGWGAEVSMSVVGGLTGAEALLLLLLLLQIRVTKHGLWLYTVQTAKTRH